SRSAVGRHRVTCHKAIIASTLEDSKAAELLEAAKEAEGTEAGITSLTRANEAFRKCRKATFDAFKRGDHRSGFQGIREMRGLLEFIADLTGESKLADEPPEQGPMIVFRAGMGISFGPTIREPLPLPPALEPGTPTELPVPEEGE